MTVCDNCGLVSTLGRFWYIIIAKPIQLGIISERSIQHFASQVKLTQTEKYSSWITLLLFKTNKFYLAFVLCLHYIVYHSIQNITNL